MLGESRILECGGIFCGWQMASVKAMGGTHSVLCISHEITAGFLMVLKMKLSPSHSHKAHASPVTFLVFLSI